MESKTLLASELPLLSGTIKDAINFGIWFLYEISDPHNPNANYSLSTSHGEFLLTHDGEVISMITEKAGIDYKYKVTFTGIPSAPVVNMPTYENIH